jgi:RNA polymerase sigma factor (TIGR02999 family)
MAEHEDDKITRLLHRVNEDADGAMDDLMAEVYEDLCRVAERHMVQEFGRGLPGVTMEPSALVNESFLRIIKQRNKYDNRGQFFAIATKVMLRVLVDYQRRRGAAKRGGDRQRITLTLEKHAEPGRGQGPDTVIGVETLVDALDGLEGLDKRKADVVKMKVVWGLTMPQVAESLNVSLATVERDWTFSKAWLAREADARKRQPPAD